MQIIDFFFDNLILKSNSHRTTEYLLKVKDIGFNILVCESFCFLKLNLLHKCIFFGFAFFLNTRLLKKVPLFELFGLVIELFLVNPCLERVKQFENYIPVIIT